MENPWRICPRARWSRASAGAAGTDAPLVKGAEGLFYASRWVQIFPWGCLNLDGTFMNLDGGFREN